jgi:hypothetical protein
MNGDGYSDVVVGSFRWDNGQIDEGLIFFYPGSPTGLSLAHTWISEGNQASAEFGNPVGTAGDVNGDGYSDMIVGAYKYSNGQTAEGRAYVFYGRPPGPANPADWSAESNQIGARFGFYAGTAGDVNGDGFADVIIGAYQYDNGQADEGRAFVYYGNGDLGGSGRDGLDRIARQVRTDDTAPVALLGRSDSQSAFRLKALGRTAAGRGHVRMQYEVKPLGVAFDGQGLVTGPKTDTGAPGASGSAVPLSELANGLAPDALYHWRLRLVADSPFFPRTPWFSMPGNASTETDLRTASPTTGIEAAEAPGIRLHLEAPQPNPFGTSAAIGYTLPRSGRVRVAVYDATGRARRVLVDAVQAAGRHMATWDGRGGRGIALPAGVYFVRLAFDGHVETQKLVLAP